MIQQQNLPINFSGDLDLKTDIHQVAPNNFIGFNNAVRTTGGLFKKRNGFDTLGIFGSNPSSLATLSGSLVGIGGEISVYSPDTGSVIARSPFQPVDLSVLPAIRNSANQSSADVAVASNGLACVVATDSQAGGIYKIIDSVTGSTIVPITVLNSSVNSQPRVYLLGTYFIIIYTSGTTLEYIAIPISNPLAPGSQTSIGSMATNNTANPFDAIEYANVLYIVWNSSDNGNASYSLNTLSSSLVLGTRTVVNTSQATQFSLTVDGSGGSPVLWLSFASFVSSSNKNFIYSVAYSLSFSVILAQTEIIEVDGLTQPVYTVTSSAAGGEVAVVYSYTDPSAVNLNFSAFATCTQGGSVSVPRVIKYGIQVASKSFINPIDSNIYFLAAYISSYQPTYFLINISGTIVGRLAYSNGGLQVSPGPIISSVNQNGDSVQIAYLYKDQLFSVNKSNGSNPGNASGIYSEAGVNIATFTLGATDTLSSEIAGSLALSGGFLWMFDGTSAVEQNFHVYPDAVTVSEISSGGGIQGDITYFYQVTYEWTDASGNIHRSAPSIPVEMDLSGTAGTTFTITLTIPYLALTAKVAPNPVRIVVYRWSTDNPVYTQVSSITTTSGSNNLIINSLNGGTVNFVDKLPTSSVIGNNPLYTNGGVVEDTGAPASNVMALFDTRLWLVDAEDRNLLWFSKQVIENTPVEMSDLFTFYVAPTTSSQASSGPITGLAPMDDKLVLFKGDPSYQNAIYYINGTGPDNTGANNQYSQPIFITSAVGCNNQKSIVLTPAGLMFQSSQGIWLLGRDLSTSYIGSPVEAYNSDTVTSAVSIPGTTQVRFTLNTGTELVYDYFYQKWDTCSNIPAISSVVFQSLHTYLDASGNIWQETPGQYVDGSTPVTMSLTTPWYNLAGLQGYIRAYSFYLLGTYLSPHTLTINIYYDYSTTVAETVTIDPTNFGTSSTLEQWRVMFSRQKCMAFMLQIIENYDASKGVPAGAGLSLSGINLLYGVNRGSRPIPAANTVGAS